MPGGLFRIAKAYPLAAGSPIGVEKFAGEIQHDLLSHEHAQTPLSGDLGDFRGLKVFFVGGGDKGRHILRRQKHGHALLRF